MIDAKTQDSKNAMRFLSVAEIPGRLIKYQGGK